MINKFEIFELLFTAQLEGENTDQIIEKVQEREESAQKFYLLYALSVFQEIQYLRAECDSIYEYLADTNHERDPELISRLREARQQYFRKMGEFQRFTA